MSEATKPHVGLTAARVAAAGALVVVVVWVLWPFLTPLAWGAILAYATWPVYRRLPGREQRPGLLAALLTLGVAVGIGIPVAILLITLADEARDLLDRMLAWRDAGLPVPEAVRELPLAARVVELGAAVLDPSHTGAWLERTGTALSRQLVGLAGGLVRNIVKFGVAMVSIYAFYLSGERLIELGRRLAPLLFPVAPARFLESIGAAVRAVLFGLLGTAIVQGILAGAGLAVAGVPSPAALGAATAVLSILPGGSSAVSLVAAAWLGLGGRWLAAVGLALWSLLVVSSMDNILRPFLISERGRIPFFVVFLGVLGGLAAFGLVGIFIGPVVLSVGFALLAELVRSSEIEDADPGEARAPTASPESAPGH